MEISPLRFFTALRDQGAVAHFVWQGRPACLVNAPALVEYVLGEGAGNFLNPWHEFADLAPYLTPAGRRLLALQRPDSTSESLDETDSFEQLERVVHTAHARLFDVLDETAAQGRVIDVADLLKVAMLRLFTRLLFGVEVEMGGAERFHRAAALQEQYSVQARARPGLRPPQGVTMAADFQHQFAFGVLAARWQALGGSLTPVEAAVPTLVRATVRTLLNAYNAMATTAAWSLYLLARYPESQASLVEEGVQVLGDAGNLRRPGLRDTRRLPRLRQLIEEAQRLYPSAWLLGRTARAAQRFDASTFGASAVIPAAALVYISPYTLHRDPRFWDQPDAFRPERFADPDPQRPRAAYLPFGGGPRRCPARPLSLPLLQLLLAEWIGRYRSRLVDGARVVPWPLISLRPHPAVPLRLERR